MFGCKIKKKEKENEFKINVKGVLVDQAIVYILKIQNNLEKEFEGKLKTFILKLF